MDDKLKTDFPVDWEEDQHVSRREFLKFVTLASGGLAAGSVALAGWSELSRQERQFDAISIVRVGELQVGQAKEFRYPRAEDLCLLLQPEPGVYKAYSRRCTHLSCPVEYQPEKERLYCPCHNGAFSTKDGKVLQGPPPRPLPEIIVEVRGDEVFAIGVRKGSA